MEQGTRRNHALVLYQASDRADATLRAICERISRVTVVSLARDEAQRSGCCDTRSLLWNRVCRELASEDLSSARRVVTDPEAVDFLMLLTAARDAPAALAREAVARRADEIIIADPRRSGLGRLELRRLRRSSAVPVRS
jgi:hypothetical protein